MVNNHRLALCRPLFLLSVHGCPSKQLTPSSRLTLLTRMCAILGLFADATRVCPSRHANRRLVRVRQTLEGCWAAEAEGRRQYLPASRHVRNVFASHYMRKFGCQWLQFRFYTRACIQWRGRRRCETIQKLYAGRSGWCAHENSIFTKLFGDNSIQSEMFCLFPYFDR